MNRRPAAFLFLSSLFGALVGFKSPASLLFLFSSLFIVLLFLILRHRLARVMLLLLFGFFVCAFTASFSKTRYDKTRAAIPKDEQIFIGQIKTVATKEDGRTFAIAVAYALKNPTTIFNLRIELPREFLEIPLRAGQQIRFYGKAEPFLEPLSLAHFDAVRFGLSRNIHGRIRLHHKNAFFVTEIISPSYFENIRHTIFERVQQVLTPREAAILFALMVGNVDFLSREQTEIYRTIGAQHLLAVSGLQVTILTALCFIVLSPVFHISRRYSHRAQALAALATIIFGFWFIGLAGFSCSAVRAFLMTTFILLRNFFARAIDEFDSFYASGVVTILLDPVAILDLGYLLSYAAVFGLLVANQRSAHFLSSLKKTSRVLCWIVSLTLSTLAAFLSTLPVIACFIGTLAAYSVIANIFLVPVACVLQVPAIIFGLVGAVINAPLFMKIASTFAIAIEIFAETCSEIMGKIVVLPDFSTYVALALLLSFFALLKTSKPLFFLSGFLVMFPLAAFPFSKKHVEVTVIPVGQGDSTLITIPTGENFLIDAGGSMQMDYDVGARIVVPTLKRKGVHALNVLVITHPDPDHILGVFAVLDEISVKEIWHSGFANDHPLTKRLMKKAEDLKIPIKDTREILGSHRFNNTELQVLAPTTTNDDAYFKELSANDNSLVIRLIHGAHQLLWPGDIEYFGEELLLSSPNTLNATILKDPHHGSKTSSSEKFIDAVNPAHVIYSTGRNNRFNFPHEAVIKRYRSRGIREWNTAEHGEIVIKIYDKKIAIAPKIGIHHHDGAPEGSTTFFSQCLN